ncbi:MAG: C40 family peptidase [Bacteroidota bacterium]|nr:C40 family peptidase [Bacteroidota bacterium]
MILRLVKHIFFFGLITILLLGNSSCRSGKETAKSEHKSSSENSPKNSKKIAQKYAPILLVEENDINNIPLYSFIDEWYGVPYKFGGKNKSGIDCSNFTSTLYAEIYKKSVAGSSSGIFEQCKIVSKNDLREGDLVFFIIEGKKVSHIGVYLQNNKFVHATTKKGVMIDDLDSPYYKKYFHKGGRLK